MARKISSSARRPSSKKAAAAAVVMSVASLVGYDPTLLLPAPAQAHEVQAQEVMVSPIIEDAGLLALSLAFDLNTLSEPSVTPPATAKEIVTEAIQEAATPALCPIEGFRTMYAGLDVLEVGSAYLSVGTRFDDRASFETEEDPENTNIHKTLRKCRQALSNDIALRVLLACEVDERFINRGMREGAKYNVYAIDKLQDLVSFMGGNPSLNRINNAVLRTMIAFERAGVTFTMDCAKGAASDKIRMEPMYRPLMRSHTVSAGTASTQASSTMQALVTLGVVSSSGKPGSKNSSYSFLDTPQANAIKARLA